MDKDNEFDRNRPSEEGSRNDPNMRDESAVPPGTNTISSSDTDRANQHLTETTKDNFRNGEDSDQFADPDFDDVDQEDD